MTVLMTSRGWRREQLKKEDAAPEMRVEITAVDEWFACTASSFFFINATLNRRQEEEEKNGQQSTNLYKHRGQA